MRRKATFSSRRGPSYVLVPSPLLHDPYHIPVCYSRSSYTPAATVVNPFESPPPSLRSRDYLDTQAACLAPEQLPDHEPTVKLVPPEARRQPSLVTRRFQHPDGSLYYCTLEVDPEKEEQLADVRQLGPKDFAGQQHRTNRSPVPPRSKTAQGPADLLRPSTSVNALKKEKQFPKVEQPGTEDCVDQQRHPDRSPILTEAEIGLVLPVIRPLRWRKKTAQDPNDLEKGKQSPDIEQSGSEERLDHSPILVETETGLVLPVIRPLQWRKKTVQAPDNLRSPTSAETQAKRFRYPHGLPYPCSVETSSKEEKLYDDIEQIFEQLDAKGRKDHDQFPFRPSLSQSTVKRHDLERSSSQSTVKPLRPGVVPPVVVQSQPAPSSRMYRRPNGLPYPCSIKNDSEEDKLYATLERMLQPVVKGGCHDVDQKKHNDAVASRHLSSGV